MKIGFISSSLVNFAEINKTDSGVSGVISVSTLTKAFRIRGDKKRGQKIVIVNFLLDAPVRKDKM